jgi:hypothetical protein
MTITCRCAIGYRRRPDVTEGLAQRSCCLPHKSPVRRQDRDPSSLVGAENVVTVAIALPAQEVEARTWQPASGKLVVDEMLIVYLPPYWVRGNVEPTFVRIVAHSGKRASDLALGVATALIEPGPRRPDIAAMLGPLLSELHWASACKHDRLPDEVRKLILLTIRPSGSSNT